MTDKKRKATRPLSKLNSENLEWQLLLALFVFSSFFFLERTSFLDNPFTIFKLINDESLFINASRYPAVIMQVLPLIGIKLGLPLKVIMFLHSLGYFLIHASLFYIIRYVVKNREMSWLLLLTLIIPVAHTFFWNNNELFLGLSALCLWFALMRKHYFISSLFCGVIIAWIHPLLIVILLFFVAVSLWEATISRLVIFANAGLYTASYFTKNIFFPNYYDTSKNELLLSNLSQFDISLSSTFGIVSSLAYWPIVVSCCGVLFVLLFYKKWLYGFLLAGFICCFLVLTALTDSNPEYIFYNEGNYRVLFFAAAYVMIVAKIYQKFLQFRYIVAALVLIGFFRIGYTSSFYTDRISWFQTIATEHDRQIMTYGTDTKKKLVQSWAAPCESLILSTITGPSKTILFTEDAKSFETEIGSPKQMITTQGKFLIYNPGNKYFNLVNKNYSRGHLD